MVSTPALLRSHREDNVSPNTIARQWKYFYDNGSTQNPPISMAIASALFYVAWSVRQGSALYKPTPYSRSGLFTAAGVSILGIVPFTLVFMAKTNGALAKKAQSASEASSVEVVELLNKWTTLNFVRGLFPLVGSVCAITASLL